MEEVYGQTLDGLSPASLLGLDMIMFAAVHCLSKIAQNIHDTESFKFVCYSRSHPRHDPRNQCNYHRSSQLPYRSLMRRLKNSAELLHRSF